MRHFIKTQLPLFWQARTQRERRLLLGMTLLLAAGFFWFVLFTPLTHIAQHNRKAPLRLEADVTYLTGLADELTKLKGNAALKPLKANDLLALLKQAMQDNGFTHQGVVLTPDGELSAVRMTAEADFDSWLSLTARLAQYYQVHLVKLTANAASIPGRVKLDAHFVYAGGVV